MSQGTSEGGEGKKWWVPSGSEREKGCEMHKNWLVTAFRSLGTQTPFCRKCVRIELSLTHTPKKPLQTVSVTDFIRAFCNRAETDVIHASIHPSSTTYLIKRQPCKKECPPSPPPTPLMRHWDIPKPPETSPFQTGHSWSTWLDTEASYLVPFIAEE